MKFVIDHPFMRASYSLLSTTGPLAAMGLPSLARVWFEVIRARSFRGDATYFADTKSGGVRLSRALIKDATEGLAIMAHEMLHLAQSMAEEDGDDYHGPWFQKHGKALCRYHGWSHDQFGLLG